MKRAPVLAQRCLDLLTGLTGAGGLGVGVLCGQPVAGSAAAFAGLCLLGLRGGMPATRKIEPPGQVRRRRIRLAAIADAGAAYKLFREMLLQGRGALLLRPQLIAQAPADLVQAAREEFAETMSWLPPGQTVVRAWRAESGRALDGEPQETIVETASLYVDRFAVRNIDFAEFVAAGGYEDASLWRPEALPRLFDLVDSTGKPGPRFWCNQAPPPGLENHPVTGVSWYEADAYARWAGKRLPADAEWLRAAVAPMGGNASSPQRKFPWGEEFDRRKANLWGTLGTTVPVDAFPEGATPGGIQQLIGNVWEWTSSDFQPGRTIVLPGPMKTLRGASFDSYFDSHATPQFHSGDLLTARRHNVGFRCVLPERDVSPHAEALDEPLEESPAGPAREET